MKIYLTEEGKKEIEAKIASLENHEDFNSKWTHDKARDILKTQWYIYKKILSLATILPVEESWNECISATSEYNRIQDLKKIYSNGVIIQTK